mmetsp:Transcript_43672/g.73602  ORF Transcript_43672/g.73602 Transcript_43672/m.73602 type:complete len:206 (+) Transcript_43672:487-1104(+)
MIAALRRCWTGPGSGPQQLDGARPSRGVHRRRTAMATGANWRQSRRWTEQRARARAIARPDLRSSWDRRARRRSCAPGGREGLYGRCTGAPVPGPRPSRARPSSPARHHDSLRGYCRRRLQICDGPRGLLDEERVGGGGGVGLGGGHAVVPGVGGGAVHDGLMVGGPVVGGGGARQAVPAALVDVLHRDDGALSDLLANMWVRAP